MSVLTKEQQNVIADFKLKKTILDKIEKLEKDKKTLHAKIDKIDLKIGELAEQLKTNIKQ